MEAWQEERRIFFLIPISRNLIWLPFAVAKPRRRGYLRRNRLRKQVIMTTLCAQSTFIHRKSNSIANQELFNCSFFISTSEFSNVTRKEKYKAKGKSDRFRALGGSGGHAGCWPPIRQKQFRENHEGGCPPTCRHAAATYHNTACRTTKPRSNGSCGRPAR